MANHRLPMRGLSRRNVLTVAAGAGLVAAGAGLAGSTAAMATSARPAADSAGATPADGDPIVVRVRDRNTGALELFLGARRVEIRDPDLAGRIAAAAQA